MQLEYAEDSGFEMGMDLLDPGTPLAIVPMVYADHDEPLLSDWPAHLLKPWQGPPAKLDAEVTKTMKMSAFVGYASNPGTRLRNQVPT